MATLTLNGLESALGALDLDALPAFERTKPLDKPLDIARCYLASIIEKVANVGSDAAYNAIQWPNNVYNGDLVVILPKLSRGGDPEEYALQIIPKVIQERRQPFCKDITEWLASFHAALSSFSHSQMGSTYGCNLISAL